MMYSRLVLLQLCIFFSSVSGMKPDEFSYQRLLQKKDTIQSEPAAFRLDYELYRHTENDFSDLRLFNSQGQEVSYHIRFTSNNDTATTRESVPMKLLSFKKSGTSGANILFCRKKEDAAPEEMIIVTPLRNFEKKVSVLGSNDQKHWIKLSENQPIFDYSQFIDMRNTAINFDSSDFIYFNLVINSISDTKQSGISRVLLQSAPDAQTKYTEFLQHQEPFRLEEVQFYALKKHIDYGAPHIDQYDLTIDSIVNDTLNRITTIHVSSNKEPVNTISISTSACNFSRQVNILGTDDTARNASWMQLASGEIFCIQIDNFKRKQTEIEFSTTSRFLHYKLDIQNKDNQPISVAAVMGSGPRHEVIFFHKGMTSLKVCYKADSSFVPTYDVGTILQNAPVINGNIWSLGNPVMQRNLSAQKKPSIFSSRNVVTAVVCLMVVVLAFVLFMAFKKIEMK